MDRRSGHRGRRAGLVAILSWLLLCAPAFGQGNPAATPLTTAELAENLLANESILALAQQEQLEHLPELGATPSSLDLTPPPALVELPDGAILDLTLLHERLNDLDKFGPESNSPLGDLAGARGDILNLLSRLETGELSASQQQTLTELWAIEHRAHAAFFAAIDPLPFPRTSTETLPLREVLSDYPASFDRAMSAWPQLASVDTGVVQDQLEDLSYEIRAAADTAGIGSTSQAAWLERWRMAASEFPPPAGASNLREIRARFGMLVEWRESLIAAPPVTPATTSSAETEAAIRRVLDPAQFREPLQIPKGIDGPDSQWLVQLLQRIFSGLGSSNRTLPPWVLWMLVLLVTLPLLLSWLMLVQPGVIRRRRLLKAGGLDPVAGRSLALEEQFAKAQEAIAAGDLLAAWHWLTQGFLIGLADRKLVRLDWSRTNREYVRELQHGRPETYGLARRFFRAAEGAVFGGTTSSAEEIRGYHDELLQFFRTLKTPN